MKKRLGASLVSLVLLMSALPAFAVPRDRDPGSFLGKILKKLVRVITFDDLPQPPRP